MNACAKFKEIPSRYYWDHKSGAPGTSQLTWCQVGRKKIPWRAHSFPENELHRRAVWWPTESYPLQGVTKWMKLKRWICLWLTDAIQCLCNVIGVSQQMTMLRYLVWFRMCFFQTSCSYNPKEGDKGDSKEIVFVSLPSSANKDNVPSVKACGWSWSLWQEWHIEVRQLVPVRWRG